jgi:hypothetical protein
MQGGWQPPPGGGGQGYGAPPGGGGYGQPPGPPQGYGAPPPSMGFQQNPYGAQGAPGMMGPSYGNYEFNDAENAIIDKVASRAKLWGIIATTVGALQCVSSCFTPLKGDLLLNLPTGIVGVVVGITFMGVGNSLKLVVTTQGNDLMHMMQALDKMSGAFMVQIIAAIVGFVLTLLAFLFVAFVLVAAAAAS